MKNFNFFTKDLTKYFLCGKRKQATLFSVRSSKTKIGNNLHFNNANLYIIYENAFLAKFVSYNIYKKSKDFNAFKVIKNWL